MLFHYFYFIIGSNLGDRVFHKFCKSFSLRFLRKPADHEAENLKTSNDCSPCTDKIICEPGGTQLLRYYTNLNRTA